MSQHPPRAYRNPEFLNGPEARPIRILSEYLEPRTRLRRFKVSDTIVFFGSSRFRDRETTKAIAAAADTPEAKAHAEVLLRGADYYEDARELSRRITEWAAENREAGHHFVVCTGGGGGIMEAANRGAKEAGGQSIGFNISLPFEQEPNPYITPELSFEFHYFFMRKLWFAYLGKALVVFPGGFGTMDELMEILTLVQTNKLRKQVLVVVYAPQFWKKVLNLEALAELGTISPEDVDLFQYAETVDEAYEKLTTWLQQRYLRG
jgi:uncharacterized protein (TIGR00730 family)